MKSFAIPSLMLLCAIPDELMAQTVPAPLTVYVTEFRSDTNVEPRLLNSVTEDFETIVVQSKAYTVLERRRFGALLNEIKTEADLAGRPTLLDQVKRQGLQGILFGQLEYDTDDGNYVFYVSLVMLDRTKVWKRDASLRRSLIGDRESRVTVLRKLLDDRGSQRDLPPLGNTRRPSMVGQWELTRDQNGRVEVTQIQFRQGRSGEEGTFEFAAGGPQPGRFQGTWHLDSEGNLALGFGPEPLRVQPDGSFRGVDDRGATLVLVRR